MLFPPLNPPPATWIDSLGNFLLLGAALSVLAFGLTYGLGSNWRKYPAGRSIMYFVSGLIFWSIHTVITRFTGGDWLFRDVFRALVYGYLMVVSLKLLWTLIQIQRNGNHPTDPQEILRKREAAATKKRDRDRRAWLRRRGREARP